MDQAGALPAPPYQKLDTPLPAPDTLGEMTRLKPKPFLLVVLALAFLAAAPFVRSFLFPGKDRARLKQSKPPQRASATRPNVKTNSIEPPPEGFYSGKGDARVFVNYASHDPLLRSFLQSVMEGEGDPNAKGREIFLKICAACHQNDGEGKDGVAPPLAGSEWALAPGGVRLARIVLNGLTGPIRVGNKDWNLPMPPWRDNLDDDQVAIVLTYVRTQLGDRHAGPIAAGQVAAARKQSRPVPETADELLRISDP